MPIDKERMATIRNVLKTSGAEGAQPIINMLEDGEASIYPKMVFRADTPAVFRAKQAGVDTFINGMMEDIVTSHDASYAVWAFNKWNQEKEEMVKTLANDNIQSNLETYSRRKFMESKMGVIKSELINAVDKTLRDAEKLHQLQLNNDRGGDQDRYNEMITELNAYRAKILATEIPDTVIARKYADQQQKLIASTRNSMSNVANYFSITNKLRQAAENDIPSFVGQEWKPEKKDKTEQSMDKTDRAIAVENSMYANNIFIAASEEEITKRMQSVTSLDQDTRYNELRQNAANATARAMAAKDPNVKNALLKQALGFKREADVRAAKKQQELERSMAFYRSQRKMVGSIIDLFRQINDFIKANIGNYDHDYAVLERYHLLDMSEKYDEFQFALDNKDVGKLEVLKDNLQGIVNSLSDVVIVEDADYEHVYDEDYDMDTEQLKTSQTISDDELQELIAAGLMTPEEAAGQKKEEQKDATTQTVNVSEEKVPSFNMFDLMDND